jgi:hypothetical protein
VAVYSKAAAPVSGKGKQQEVVTLKTLNESRPTENASQEFPAKLNASNDKLFPKVIFAINFVQTTRQEFFWRRNELMNVFF